jgi:hypothetical protein
MPENPIPSSLALPPKATKPSVLESVRIVNDRIDKYPAKIAEYFRLGYKTIIGLEAGFLFTAGFLMVQVTEWAIAMACWIALGFVLLIKSLSWAGFNNRQVFTGFSRTFLSLGAIGLSVLLCFWTVLKKPQDQVWTAFQNSSVSHKKAVPTTAVEKEIQLLPLTFDAYAWRDGNHPPGMDIAGIKWNEHFTDLRVWVRNETELDYGNLYINIQPDQWNYKAAIVGESHGCTFSYMGGASVLVRLNTKGKVNRATIHQEQMNFSAGDNTGHEWDHLIDKGGYRLECGRLSAHDSVQVVFALAAEKKSAPPVPSDDKLKPGQWAVSLYGSKSASTSILDDLDVRPNTSTVTIDGHYAFGPKRISLEKKTISVGDGN